VAARHRPEGAAEQIDQADGASDASRRHLRLGRELLCEVADRHHRVERRQRQLRQRGVQQRAGRVSAVDAAQRPQRRRDGAEADGFARVRELTSGEQHADAEEGERRRHALSRVARGQHKAQRRAGDGIAAGRSLKRRERVRRVGGDEGAPLEGERHAEAKLHATDDGIGHQPRHEQDG